MVMTRKQQKLAAALVALAVVAGSTVAVAAWAAQEKGVNELKVASFDALHLEAVWTVVSEATNATNDSIQVKPASIKMELKAVVGVDDGNGAHASFVTTSVPPCGSGDGCYRGYFETVLSSKARHPETGQQWSQVAHQPPTQVDGRSTVVRKFGVPSSGADVANPDWDGWTAYGVWTLAVREFAVEHRSGYFGYWVFEEVKFTASTWEVVP